MRFLRPPARTGRLFLLASVSSLVIAFAAPQGALAQVEPEIVQPASSAFTQQQIEKLVAPIALYPDVLLAQLLPAAAYPTDIVQASRWLARNRQAAERQDFSSADAQRWDPSVKALLRFPTVLEKLNADLDWTVDLGEAFVNQPQDVAAAIQILRDQAASAGVLQSNAQQRIRRVRQDEREVIIVESIEPDVIYVPTYDPVTAYRPGPSVATAALITFGTAVVIGAILSQRDPWDWRRGHVYRPVWPGYPAWRPPYPGWRPGMPVRPVGHVAPVHTVNGGAVRPWRPDPTRYRPAIATRPALVRPPVNAVRPQQIRPQQIRPQQVRPVITRPERPQWQTRPTQRPSVAPQRIERPAAVTRPAVTRPAPTRPNTTRPVINRHNASPPPAIRRPEPSRPAPKAKPSRSDRHHQ